MKAAILHKYLKATRQLTRPRGFINLRTVATASHRTNRDLIEGDLIHNYRVEKIDSVKELNIKQIYLRHQPTGAEHLHIHKDADNNNVFAVALRTPPTNSSGVAHILEHSTLCGSERYPTRDPFMKMLTRSLATFMNAMTGADYTVYPFSTLNKKDFENLLNVYTDAVFFPRLRPLDFRQEGWRLEHEVPDNNQKPIIIKGVVYNEMKGVFSSSSAIFARQQLNHMFPDTTYHFESGGDPEHIPELTYEELKKFHQLYYHPSNAKFFTYGDSPLEEHLEIINKLVLSKFDKNSHSRKNSFVQVQVPWDKPRSVEIACPPDPTKANPDKQTTTSLSFLMRTDIADLNELFALQILSSLLIDGPNAPLFKSLIESGIGADYSPCTGLENSTKQPFFSIGLQDVHKDDVPRVHQIIEDTLREVARQGFPQDRIEALLHDIELNLKHIRTDFGLRLVMNFLSVWNHDADVTKYLSVNERVEEFKKNLATDEQYWNKLINKHFLTNTHKLSLTMTPNVNYVEERDRREKRVLENKLAGLSEADKQTILDEGVELMKAQHAEDDTSILPCLEPSKDISRDLIYNTELKFDSHRRAKIQLCEQPTNEIIYFRGLTDVSGKLNDDLMDYLPLFCDVATKLGAGAYNRHQLAQKSQLVTGGLGVTMMINPSLDRFDQHRNEVCISSHCLKRNVGNMFELWSNVFKRIHFQENKEFLFQLIRAAAAELSDGIASSGHAYAIKRSSSSLSSLASSDEKLSGLSMVARMKDMASKENVDSIATKLQRIAHIVLNPSNMKYAFNAESSTIQYANDELKKFLDETSEVYAAIPINTIQHMERYERSKVEDMKFPFATHFVARSLITVPKLHKDFSKLVIMSKLVSFKYLLREVREKGGAYGAGARLSNSGILSFFSYRDPNSLKTIEAFERSADWLMSAREYSDKDVEESKLGVFQDIDRPVEPGRRGLNYFTLGETDEMRQNYRRNLLDVSKKDIASVARKYLRQEKVGSCII